MTGPRAERRSAWVSVVIPALNEADTIARVVGAVPRGIADEVIVVDNGSDDATAEQARTAGARVVRERQRGYGRACAAGARAVHPRCAVIVFLDGDGSDRPELMGRLVAPILAGEQDFVIGSRLRGRREAGSMGASQVLAARLAGILVRLRYGVRYSDMCPFRAIRRGALERLGMREPTYGWNLEMQMRAAALGLRILEVPVDHRRRAGGSSKVSGTLRGTLAASVRITATFARVAFGRARGRPAAAG
jgi:glycosyltransferase involved in cell wall biosynthesis